MNKKSRNSSAIKQQNTGDYDGTSTQSKSKTAMENNHSRKQTPKTQPYPQREFSTYANESEHSRQTTRHTEALSYADNLKHRYSNRRTHPTAGNINYN